MNKVASFWGRSPTVSLVLISIVHMKWTFSGFQMFFLMFNWLSVLNSCAFKHKILREDEFRSTGGDKRSRQRQKLRRTLIADVSFCLLYSLFSGMKASFAALQILYVVELAIIWVNCCLGRFSLVVDYPSSSPCHFCLPNSFHEKNPRWFQPRRQGFETTCAHKWCFVLRWSRTLDHGTWWPVTSTFRWLE